MESFLIHALLGGLGVALMAGPLGCFIAWQRLSYFGDTIAHAALLGVVLGLAFDVDTTWGVLATSLLLALVLVQLQKERRLASDTLLGVLAHGALALGLVLLALATSVQVDVQAYLFGDILAVSTHDLLGIFSAAALVLVALIVAWPRLMMMVMNAEIAQVEGVHAARLRMLLMLLIALVVAVSIKVVGMLLITSMLIIPAASARYFARTPSQMAVLASCIGAASVSAGLYASLVWDTPSGPSVILAALALFAVSHALRRVR